MDIFPILLLATLYNYIYISLYPQECKHNYRITPFESAIGLKEATLYLLEIPVMWIRIDCMSG